MTDIKTNSFRAWILASRPKTLTGCITPVIIGSTLAYSYITQHPESGLVFKIIPFVLCMLFAMFMQIDANLINDYYDFVKGTDREDRLGPERACAQGWVTLPAMRMAIGITTVLSCIAGLPLILYGVWWKLILIGVACVIFCFLYTYGLSYIGMGDVLVLVFFGLVPVCVTFYLQTGTCDSTTILISLATGLVIDNLLMINNFRDYEQDKISGKRTLVVKLGKRTGGYLYLIIGLAAYATCVVALGIEHIATFLLLSYISLHYKAWKKMMSIYEGKQLNGILGMTARNIFLFGLILSLSIIFQKYIENITILQ